MSRRNREDSLRTGRPRRNQIITRRIGANIRRAREAKGYTQAYLAQLIGETGEFANHVVSKWERGENRPSDEKLERIADVLDLPGIGWFFEIRDEPGEAAA